MSTELVEGEISRCSYKMSCLPLDSLILYSALQMLLLT